MVRSSWKSALVMVMAWAGLAFGQQRPQENAISGEHYVLVEEAGKPSQKCRVLFCWTMEDGKKACQAQNVNNGEILTIVDPPLPQGAPVLVGEAPAPSQASQVFHWGKSKTPPPGFPVPPDLTGKGVVLANMATQTPTPETPPVIVETPAEPPVIVETPAEDPLLHPNQYAVKKLKQKFPEMTEEKKNTNPLSQQGMQGNPFSYKGIPPGMRSVIAANNGSQGQVMYMPVPIPTVPSPIRRPVPPTVHQPTPPQPQMQPNQFVNAFTPVYPRRPMPSPAVAMMPGYPVHGAPVGYPGMPAPTMHPAYAMQTMPYPAPSYSPGLAQVDYQNGATNTQPVQIPSSAPAVSAEAATGAAVDSYQMVTVLKTSLYPAQREWVAIGMSKLDQQRAPHAVQALLEAVKDDPAATVRLACIQALVQMKVSSETLVPALEGLKSDSDPRVRSAAEQALNGIGAAPAPAPVGAEPLPLPLIN